MAVEVVPGWMAELEDEDVVFIKKFVLASGSLKDMAGQYGVTYPTVRLRLDKLIQKIQINDQRQEAPFQAYIKSLAVDGRIDLETAKDILDHYQRETPAPVVRPDAAT